MDTEVSETCIQSLNDVSCFLNVFYDLPLYQLLQKLQGIEEACEDENQARCFKTSIN